ncbi:choice-of-anchor D domain-containing protein [Myxococcota bacterium]|nr:choice-of-anchor D domain-containing protein [Myxococcota bacterium]
MTKSSLSRLPLVLSLIFAAHAQGCSDDADLLVVARCQVDAECPPGSVCESGECVPKDSVSCAQVEGGIAILQPGPPVVDFGEVGPATSLAELKLRNIGTCTLTIFEASFASEEAGSPFGCELCADPSAFPIELFPFRETTIELTFAPDAIGEVRDELVLLSDDAEYPELRIPLKARYLGQPEVIATPNSVEFGYLAEGRTISRNVRITNRGTGTAKLEITKVEIQPSSTTAFSLESELTEPVILDPLGVDRDAGLTVAVRYHPRDFGRHRAELVVTSSDPQKPTYRVPLSGTSETPAKISISPEEIRLGPVPLGRTNALPLTIVNQGGSPLEVRYRWGGTNFSTDLSASPQLVPNIAVGGYTELQVLATATAPGPINGLLILETNDPTRPTLTVPVSAEGQDVVGAEVLKIDMSYENGDNSFFDEDFRNVDLTLENPFGLVCSKQQPNPTNWGAFGNPSWVGLGATEEPERVVLVDAQQDGVYRVMLSYAEDCASLPSGVASAILGIGVDVLIAVTLGATIPGVSGDSVSDVIDEICFDHASAAATLTISVNGRVIAERPATLARKGDYIYPVEIVRQNGQFTVR